MHRFVVCACCFILGLSIPLRSKVADNETFEVDVNIHVLQHNPNGDCFETTDLKCEQMSWFLFTRLLQTYNVDFASLMRGGNYEAPLGWKQADHLVGFGKVSLAWDSHKWSKKRLFKSSFGASHPVVVAHFENKWFPDLAVVVGSFQYPELPTAPDNVAKVRDFISSVRGPKTSLPILFLFDTNGGGEDRDVTLLLKELGVKDGFVRSTPEVPTCCGDTGYKRSVDKIATNFGKSFERIEDSIYANSTWNYTQTPPWAARVKVNNATTAWHHPIMAELVLSCNASVPFRAAKIQLDDDLTATWIITLGALSIMIAAVVLAPGARGGLSHE